VNLVRIYSGATYIEREYYGFLSPVLMMYLLTWLTELPQVDPKIGLKVAYTITFTFTTTAWSDFRDAQPHRLTAQSRLIRPRTVQSVVSRYTD